MTAARAMLCAALAVAARADGAEPALAVAATVQPVAMIVRELGGGHVAVTSLVPPGASPHVFEPQPSDLAHLEDTRLLVQVGGGLDAWAARLAGATTRGPAARLTLLDAPGVAPLPADPGHRAGAGDPRDPHVWLDPLRVRDALAPAIAVQLAALDPSHRADYERRLAEFQQQLTELDAEIRATLAGRGRGYVAFHAAWRYFGARYGLTEIGVVEEAPGEEPGPRELAALIAAARAAGVAAILVEPQLGPRAARVLASELDVELVTVDPNGDPSDPERARYADLMRWNARAFARALGEKPAKATR